jgi:flagellar biosynthesis chaperone FliJ
MADLVVTKAVLEDSAKDLKAISDEFKNMSKLWDNGTIWGHDVVKSAMDDFIDDWWVKREKLQVQLDNLTKKMDEAAKTWTDTEEQLASTFDQK